MTTEQITEALAHLSVSPSRRQPVETWDEAWFESFDVVLAAARDHLTCLRERAERPRSHLSEALADVEDLADGSEPDSFWALVGAARKWEKAQRDWVSCPTCEGDGVVMPTNEFEPDEQPCPGCVGGLVPSAELVERVAERLKTEVSNGGWMETSEFVRFILLASRQGT